jgi:hypothetical protein
MTNIKNTMQKLPKHQNSKKIMESLLFTELQNIDLKAIWGLSKSYIKAFYNQRFKCTLIGGIDFHIYLSERKVPFIVVMRESYRVC